MGSYIRPLLFGWQHFILYEKNDCYLRERSVFLE